MICSLEYKYQLPNKPGLSRTHTQTIVMHSPNNRHPKHKTGTMLLSVGRVRSLRLLIGTSSRNSRGHCDTLGVGGWVKESGVPLDPKWPRGTHHPTIHVYDCHYNKRRLKFCTTIVIHSPTTAIQSIRRARCFYLLVA